MAINVLELDDFESDNFNIIAIHTNLEAYRLAYLINQKAQISLEKSLNNLELSKFGLKTSFEHFMFEDKNNQIFWSLVANYSFTTKLGYTNDYELCELKELSEITLVPEYADVSFFLKIEETQNKPYITNLLRELSTIDHVQKTFEIDKNTLVSINNLLF